MMHVDPKNPNCAYMWMEHTLSLNRQSDLADWLDANSSISATCTGGPGMSTQESCHENGMDDFDKIRFWITPVPNRSLGEGACVPYYRWVSDYIGVIGGR